MRTVTIYGRPGCCLCDQALVILERVRERVPFVLEQRDIESDDALLAAYLERIPVVAIDGYDRFELIIEEGEFERTLRDQMSV